MTLKGADGIIIMVNPAAEHAAETRESVAQLRDFLSAYGVGLHETPAVLQLDSSFPGNHPDDMMEIAAALDLSQLPTSRSNSVIGEGLLEALTTLSRQVLDRVRVQEEVCESETSPSELEALEPSHLDLPAASHEMPHYEESPQVALLSQEVVSENGTIRIPLEIMQGNSVRRLVVTVNVELE